MFLKLLTNEGQILSNLHIFVICHWILIDYGRVLFTSNIDLSHNLDNQFGGTEKNIYRKRKFLKLKAYQDVTKKDASFL